MFDYDTGLYYYRNRYYDPELGRFITPDPLGPTANPNLYTYVGNNPVNYVDSLGLCWGKATIEAVGPGGFYDENGIFRLATSKYEPINKEQLLNLSSRQEWEHSKSIIDLGDALIGTIDSAFNFARDEGSYALNYYQHAFQAGSVGEANSRREVLGYEINKIDELLEYMGYTHRQEERSHGRCPPGDPYCYGY